MIGTLLDGKYLVKRQIGSGAMGAVYEAEHAATGRRVAVKVISASELTRDQMMITRFQREARAAGGIDTQHITQVLDAGVDAASELPFLVMEFMVGEDIQQLIKRLGTLSPDLALRICAQACLGLQKAHEANVVHRDIKPANLFLAKRDAGESIVKLLDFGIAKVAMDQAQETESAGLTRTGSMLGSPLYMSPEQARGQKDIDHRTDIWSLGVVLYQALCGRSPYQHITALGQLIIAICHEWPPHVQEVAPWVPLEVAEIVHRALRHNPNERFQTAEEMFRAIRRLLPQGWGIHEEMVAPLDQSTRGLVAPRLALTGALSAAQTTPGAASTQAGATTAESATSVTMAQRPAASRKAPLFVAVAAITLAGAGGVFAFTRHPAPLPQPLPVVAKAAPIEPVMAPAPKAPTEVVPPAAPPADLASRRVKVVIMPADAQAEIEGEKALVKAGVLEIAGVLGSVRRVRIFKGKAETTVDVIVTESGPSPPKIELTFGGAKPAASAVAAAAAPATAAPKAGIVTQFE
jgi:serine/threonine-protein kinase